jgi:hypothetical protein
LQTTQEQYVATHGQEQVSTSGAVERLRCPTACRIGNCGRRDNPSLMRPRDF